MARIPFICALALSLIVPQIMPIGTLRAQAPSTTGNEHLNEVACVDIPPDEKRPEFGCFNIGTVTGLHFSQPSVYWHLRAFPNRKAAEAAKSATGIVVEEDGRAWLSEFGPRDIAPRGGKAVAVIGPMQLPVAKTYSAVLSYAVMRPRDSSRVHTHPGPEGWYVLAGEQCLETPAGANRAQAGGTMTVPPNIPMELNVTGTTLRRAFALVIHADSAHRRGARALNGNRPEPVTAVDTARAHRPWRWGQHSRCFDCNLVSVLLVMGRVSQMELGERFSCATIVEGGHHGAEECSSVHGGRGVYDLGSGNFGRARRA